MEFFLKKPTRGKTKVLSLVDNGKTLDLKIYSTKRRKGDKAGLVEVQARELFFQGKKYDKWKKEGSLLELISECIGYKHVGYRQDLLDHLYYTEKGLL